MSVEAHLPEHIRRAQEMARKHKALKTIRAKQTEQVKLLEEIPLEIAKAARNLQQVIKLWYPIEGQPWKYALSKTAGLATSAECNVYNAQLRLLSLLDHDRKPTQYDPDECPIRFAWWPPALISWNDLDGALEAMANDNHLIALHYGWTDALYHNRPWLKWDWPNIPAIPAHFLQALLDDAERIENLTFPCLEKIRKEISQPSAAGEAGKPDQADGNGASGRPIQQPQQIEWTTADGPTQWAKLFDISPTTLKRRFSDGKIRHKKLSAKSYQIAIDDLPARDQEKYRNAKN